MASSGAVMRIVPTGRFLPAVAPLADEPVVVKTAPNAFVGTDLGDRVDAAGNKQVIVIGFMTHMCGPSPPRARSCAATSRP
ncbi:Isochorismatase [plant metagenome]|uniref:Isochorismatase n=1 Tax=plant metagenome TaxID=1297885 RepID=A0A484R8A0_9ZZZZ